MKKLKHKHEQIEPPPPSTSGVSNRGVEVPWEAHQTTNPNENEHIKQHFDSLNGMNGNCSDAGSQSSANCDDKDEIRDFVG